MFLIDPYSTAFVQRSRNVFDKLNLETRMCACRTHQMSPICQIGVTPSELDKDYVSHCPFEFRFSIEASCMLCCLEIKVENMDDHRAE